MDTLYKGSVYRTEGRTQQDTAFFNPPQNKKHVTVDTAFDARASPFQIIQTKTIFHDHVKKTLLSLCNVSYCFIKLKLP